MQKPVLTIAANAIVAKIIGADDQVKNLVSDWLSYLVEGFDHMAFKPSGWDGRSSFFTRRTCTFPAGFVYLVHNQLITAGYQVRIAKKPLPKPLGPENPIVDEFGNDDPRYDFQPRSLRQVEKHGRGIIQVATGGGKSKIAKLIAARYRRMTLFITTRGVLMYQMKKAVERDLKWNCGIMGDGEWSPVKGFNAGMVQTFVAQLKEPSLDQEARDVASENVSKGLRWSKEVCLKEAQRRFDAKVMRRARLIKILELVEVVIGEEAHEAGGNSYYEILQYCKNAQIRVALTATPFMRDNAEDNMRLMAAFGPILIKVSEKLLIDRGILATPYFRFVDSKPHDKLRKTSPWQRAYTLGYMENPYMLADVVREAHMAASMGLPVLTLIVRPKHGQVIKAAMERAGLRVAFIYGKDDQTERERALNQLRDGKIDVLIGSTILDVGVDVPAITLIQLVGGHKAEVTLRQRIGRGLRAKKFGPNIAFISDYTSNINLTLREHAKTRRAIIEATPGFVENILKQGDDFPWHLFKKSSEAAAA